MVGTKGGEEMAAELFFNLQVLGLQHPDALLLVSLVDFLIHGLVFDDVLGDVQSLAGALFVEQRGAVGRLETGIETAIFPTRCSNESPTQQGRLGRVCHAMDMDRIGHGQDRYLSWFSSRERGTDVMSRSKSDADMLIDEEGIGERTGERTGRLKTK